MKEHKTIERQLNWLVKNSQFLSIRKIEQELDMPSTTLYKYVTGERELPEKWREPLSGWVAEFIKQR